MVPTDSVKYILTILPPAAREQWRGHPPRENVEFRGSIHPTLPLAPNHPFPHYKYTLLSASHPRKSALARSLPERRGPVHVGGGGDVGQNKEKGDGPGEEC
jgi:hypothetical protein